MKTSSLKSNAFALHLLYQESAPHRCVCGEYLLPLVLTPSMVIIHQVLFLFWREHPSSFSLLYHNPNKYCTSVFPVCRMIHINWKMTLGWIRPSGQRKCAITQSPHSGPCFLGQLWNVWNSSRLDLIFVVNFSVPELLHFRSGMVATLEAVWNRGHAVFGAACYMHGLLTTPDWQTLEVTFHILTCTMHILPKRGRGQTLEARIKK